MEEDKEKTYDYANYNGSVVIYMGEIEVKLDELIATVKGSTEYVQYQKILNRIHEFPDIERNVNLFRKKNYEIQLKGDRQKAYDEEDALRNEYASLLRNPLVREYLDAELAICRIMQTINEKLILGIDFELGFNDEGE